jgi:HD-GYP domain-containing protein (c-di-GMP phosphodiesterase class II)
VTVPLASKTRRSFPMASLQGCLEGRLRDLGLTVSFWDCTGASLVEPTFRRGFCRQLSGLAQIHREAVGRLAREVAAAERAEIATAPSGCCMLGVPIRHRRRLVGSAVACFPVTQMLESEQFRRVCDQNSLDAEFMSDLCRQQAHDAAEAPTLCHVLEWLIQDEQAKEVAAGELAELSTSLSETYEELSLLYRISSSMKLTEGTTAFLTNLCREILVVMELEGAAAVLWPREPGSGASEQVVSAGKLPVSEEQLLHIVNVDLRPRLSGSIRPIVENEFSQRAAEPSGKAASGASEGRVASGVEGIRKLIAGPLLIGDHCKGALLGINKIEGVFDTADLKLISSIGSQAAIALENHHLYDDMQNLLMGMLHALSASIDAKDPYTRGHSQRVAMISRQLAEMSGLEPERVERVYLAGLLHDIGKIGVSEGVLRKAGKLTEDEYAQIKRHPQIGANILGGIRQIQDLLPVILYHHERPDGKGYPEGLRGAGDPAGACHGKVPHEALILGLADSFDAMTSSRTYRDAMPLEAVIAEIRRCSGKQFDSRLVELFLSIDLESYLAELRRASVGPVETAVRS